MQIDVNISLFGLFNILIAVLYRLICVTSDDLTDSGLVSSLLKLKVQISPASPAESSSFAF